MSMPPLVKWRYDWKPAAGHARGALYTDFLVAKDWVSDDEGNRRWRRAPGRDRIASEVVFDGELLRGAQRHGARCPTAATAHARVRRPSRRGARGAGARRRPARARAPVSLSGAPRDARVPRGQDRRRRDDARDARSASSTRRPATRPPLDAARHDPSRGRLSDRIHRDLRGRRARRTSAQRLDEGEFLDVVHDDRGRAARDARLRRHHRRQDRRGAVRCGVARR